jgi:uncharacterized protein (DUF2237 family)
MDIKTIEKPLNVFLEPLVPCSSDPVTGYFRDGFCNTCEQDLGSHTVCVHVSKAFLEYSRFRGNDLTTPHPQWGFPGLREGDKWCLCASRWLEAHEHGMAPGVYLRRTHFKALDVVPLALLKQYALDATSTQEAANQDNGAD